MGLFHKQLFHLNEYLNEERKFLWMNKIWNIYLHLKVVLVTHLIELVHMEIEN